MIAIPASNDRTRTNKFKSPRRSPCRRFSRAKRQELRISTPTKLRMTQLGIGTFNRTAVTAYMNGRIQKFRNPESVITFQHYPRGGFVMMGLIGCCIFPVTLMGTSAELHLMNSSLLAIFSFAMVCFGLRGKTTRKEITPQPNYAAQWERMEYTNYCRSFSRLSYDSMTTAVPLQVRQLAEKLQKEFPRGELAIHYLYKDPFMEFIHEEENGSTYAEFVAFWDEDGFVH